MSKKMATVFVLLMTIHRTFAQESALDAIYQLAPWKAVNAGLSNGFASCGDVLKRGNFGFVIFSEHGGEGVIMDGVVHRFSSDGAISAVAATDTVSFAIVKIFEANQSGIRAEELSLSELTGFFDTIMMTKNLPVAIKVDGDFAGVKLTFAAKPSASDTPTEPKPAERESDRSLKNVTGTLVGFRLPSYFGEALPAGYRWYFIKRDKTIGGRVLDLRVRNIRFDFDYSHRLHTEFPAWGEFYSMP